MKSNTRHSATLDCDRSSHRRYSVKKVFLQISQYSQGDTCLVVFLIKLQTWRPATLLKRDSNTGVPLSILQNFQEQLFWKTSANGCFYYYSNYCAIAPPLAIFWSILFSSSLHWQLFDLLKLYSTMSFSLTRKMKNCCRQK